MDTTVALRCSNQKFLAKLRKNRRLELRWGNDYHAAIRDAVFALQSSPYVPSKLPPYLTQGGSQTDQLYVCKQCKDSFHFLSSFEEHNVRRSWILGFWCQRCFITTCNHSLLDGPCTACFLLECDRRSYLKMRGLRKSQKAGAIRVFYNQCQFFAHLKTHSLSVVDMADIMLMPLPADLGNKWYPELDIACEALMEHAFISRVHVMDLLKDKKVDSNWWQYFIHEDKNKDNPLERIVQSYKARAVFKLPAMTTTEQLGLSNSAKSMHDTSGKSDIEVIDLVSEEVDEKQTSSHVEEYEDNPCMSPDIAFVDCGSDLKCFEPENQPEILPTNFSQRKRYTAMSPNLIPKLTNITQPDNGLCSSSRNKKMKSISEALTDMPLTTDPSPILSKLSVKGSGSDFINTQSKNDIIRLHNKDKINVKMDIQSNIKLNPGIKCSSTIALDGSTKIEPPPGFHDVNINPDIESRVCKSQLDKSMYNGPTPMVNTGKKILTFQTSKGMDLSSIISQLSPHLGSSKRILFIGQDSESVNVHKTQEPPKNIIQVVPDAQLEKFAKALQAKMVPLCISSEIGKDVGKSSPEVPEKKLPKIQPKPVAIKAQHRGKVVYKNGKKYIVKHPLSILKSTTGRSNLTSTNEVTKRSNHEIPLKSVKPTASKEKATEQVTSLNNDISISTLTPSPSPSELSSSSSCDAQLKETAVAKMGLQKPFETFINHSDVEYTNIANKIPLNNLHEVLSLKKNEEGNVILDIQHSKHEHNPKVANKDVPITTKKWREDMLNEFSQLPYFQLKKRLEHMERIGGETPKFASSVIANRNKDNTSAIINALQGALKETEQRVENQETESETLIEPGIQFESLENVSKCISCHKTLRPISYVAGFSQVEIYDDTYCTCYKYVCQECCAGHDTLKRFAMHQRFHKKRQPYSCPECSRKFSSFALLEIHTWTFCFHTLKKRLFGCKICDIDCFQDVEYVARHFAVMHGDEKFVCDSCHTVFPSYSAYKKHSEEMHTSTHNSSLMRLMVCKTAGCVVRRGNYMSHLEEHSEIRCSTILACPFCPMLNSESDQTMESIWSHLRNEHLDRLTEIMSAETLWDILPAKLATRILKSDPPLRIENVSTEFRNTQENLGEDGMIVPKIINTRTITSEVFERGSQAMDEDLAVDFVYLNPSKSTDSNKKIKLEIDPTDDPHTETEEDTLPKILDVRSIATSISTDSTSKASPKKPEAAIISKEKEEVTKNTAGSTEDSFRSLETITSTTSSEKSNGGSASGPSSVAPEVAKKAETSNDENSVAQKSVDTSKEIVPRRTDLITIKSPAAINIAALEMANRNKADACKDSGTFTAVSKYEDTREWPKALEASNAPGVTNASGSPKCAPQERDESDIGQVASAILKPPPLARIPQHVLGFTKSKMEEGRKVVRSRSLESAGSQFTSRWRTNRSSPWRIALNGPNVPEKINQNISCHLCGESINTSWSVISGHFKEKHGHDHKLSILTPTLQRMSTDFINGGYKELLVGKKRKSDGTAPSSKRRRRWKPRKHVEGKSGDSPGLGLCIKQETAEDGKGNFVCKKCNQTCTDMSDLREHIASDHRIKGRYLICLECGENFVVAPSLQMHLKAFHGIEDPITYMSRNTSYAPDMMDDMDVEGKTTDANQCHVCKAVFEDKAAVDKHFRVHGMAFLNRKRIEAQNALKCPEKVSNGPGENRSPIKDTPKVTVRRDNPAETILEKINATI
ncbi:hypothetical protein KM043_002660 [Ampulex compressa]|nr:hypothetical protein KM043_002660 [Ampulex compressa]